MKRHAILTLGSLALVVLFSTGCIDDETSYPITGGGQIIECDGNNVTVAFTAKPTGEWCHGLIAKGQLQVVDHGDGTIFHGVVTQADGVECKKSIIWDDCFKIVYTDYIYYGGCEGKIKLPDCNKFEPVKEFELTVSLVEGCADPLVCVRVKTCNSKKWHEWSGVLELGNITVHDKGDLD